MSARVWLALALSPVLAAAQDIKAKEGRPMSLQEGDRKVTYYFLTEDVGPMFQVSGQSEVELYFRAKITVGSGVMSGQALVSVDGRAPKTFRLDFSADVRAARAKGLSQTNAAAPAVKIAVPGGTHTYEIRYGGGLTGFVRAQEAGVAEVPLDLAAAPSMPDIPLDLPPPSKKAAEPSLDLPDIVAAAPAKKGAEPALDLPDLPALPPPKKGAAPPPGLDLPDLPDMPVAKKAPGPELPDLPELPAKGKGKQPPKGKAGKEAVAELPELPALPEIPPKKKSPEKAKTIVAVAAKEPPPPAIAPLEPPPPPPPPEPEGPPPPSAITVSPEVMVASALEGATGESNGEFALGAGLLWAYGSFRLGAHGGARFYTRGYAVPDVAAFSPTGPATVPLDERRYDAGLRVGWRVMGGEGAMSLDVAAGFELSVFDSSFAAQMMGPTGGVTVGLPVAPNLEVALGLGYVLNIAGPKGSESVLGAPKGSTTYSAAMVLRFPPTARVRIGYAGEAMAQDYSNRLSNGMSLALEFDL